MENRNLPPIAALLLRSSTGSRRWCWGLVALLPLWMGCSALHPIQGVPVNYVPQEFRGETRSGKKTIDLARLRQTPPGGHFVDSGDVLGIYVEGVLGRREEVPPVHFPVAGDAPPSLGYPIPVREDGTISLPLIRPLSVRGLTIRQVEEAIRRAYIVDQQLLQAGHDRILVSLQRPRHFNVLVIRQEAGSAADLGGGGAAGGTLNLGAVKRGTGKQVSLPIYKNDVLHALAETGGLPGLDAENTIYVLRRRPPAPVPFQAGTSSAKSSPVQQVSATSTSPSQIQLAQETTPPQSLPPTPAGELPWGHSAPRSALPPGWQAPPQPMPAPPPGLAPGHVPGHAPGLVPEIPPYLQIYGQDTQIIRIPIRLHLGEHPEFHERDIILQDGDIVFIESRDTEIFYTGGLLGGGQYTLPRDYDLDVLGAIAIANGRAGGSGAGGNRIGGIAATNQDISVSASDVIILRQLPDGNQVPIKVDLNKALRDRKHRIRIQPGDYIVLQYKPHEAIAAFIERNLLAGGLIGLATMTTGNGGR